MKKISLILGLSIYVCSIYSQCPDIELNIESQADLNQFIIEFPNCKTLIGLRIGKSFSGQTSDIVDLSPLNQIEILNGDLTIRLNDNLENLNGLNLIKQIFGSVAISSNAKLKDISALKNVLNTFSYVLLEQNPELSECAIKSFCNHIESGAETIIYNNNIGCNSIQEVESECLTVDLTYHLSEDFEVLLFPNPASDKVWIKSSVLVLSLALLDHFGNEVKYYSYQPEFIEISEIPSGIYWVHFRTASNSFFAKLVIQ